MARLAAVVFLLAAVASAEDLRPASNGPSPRPGMSWNEATPQGDSVELSDGGSESRWLSIPPGGSVTAEFETDVETQALVCSRVELAARDSAPAAYQWTWSLDGGAPVAASFTSAPEAAASWTGRATVPSTRECTMVRPIAAGKHTLVLAVAADASAPVMIRLFVEKPVPAEKRPEGAASRKDRWHLVGEYRFVFGYDDNVWRFADELLHRQDDDEDLDEFNNVDANADWYMVNELNLGWAVEAPSGSWTIGFGVTDTVYKHNHILNHDDLRFSLEHGFTESDTLKYWAGWSPDRFVRNLDSEDIPGVDRSEAHYDDYRLGIRYSHEWCPSFTTAFLYEWGLEDWNSKFNERDRQIDRGMFLAGVKPFEGVGIEFEWEHIHASARSQENEIDQSYRQNGPRLGVAVDLKGFLAGVSYRYEWREYTTRNSGAIDPEHADRWDRRHVLKAMVGYRLGNLGSAFQGTTVAFEYTRTKKTTRIAGRDEDEFSPRLEESLEYDANTWELSFTTKF